MTKNQDWQILMYLCRAYYAFALKTTNYAAMGKALTYAQRVRLHTIYVCVANMLGIQACQVKPHDKTTLYNIAMIQQKGAEIVLNLEPDQRSLHEVQQVFGQAKSANE